MTAHDPNVRLRDGVVFDLATGETVVADAAEPAGDVNALTHAHGDHLYDRLPAGGELVCSSCTAGLAAARRREEPRPVPTDHPRVERLPSGHVAGSTALLADDGEQRVLYTGDVSTRDRCYLDGFEPPDADVLVVEATYGEPDYEFPPQAELERAILDWLDDPERLDRPVLLFGYALGRAQKLQALLRRSDRDRVLTTDAVQRLNTVVADHYDVSFPAGTYDAEAGLEPGDAVVLPAQLNGLDFVERLAGEYDAPTAGFSGWAVDRSYRFANDLDAAFPLSDHCDFGELVGLVEAVDPERVYTQHGSAAALADHLTGRGYEARALRANQTALSDF